MAALAIDVCVGPVDPLCKAAGGVAGSASRSASDMVLGGLGAAFVEAADATSRIALAALDATTRIDLTAVWFRQNLGVVAAVTLPAVVALFVLQVISSVLRREPGGLGRAVLGVGKAFIGAAVAIAVTNAGLVATDGVCQFIAASAGTTVEGAARRFFVMTWLAGPQAGPILQMILGLGIIIGSLLLWTVLLFRKAALLLVAVFAPIAFAGEVWDQTRVWTRRWIEIVTALVLCKVVIVVVFVVGASAFAGVGPATPDNAPTAGGASTTTMLSDLLVGLLLLTIAVFSPWLTWRFVHWSGMEAAAVMHGSVAANPVSSAMRTTASQARFTAQQAVTTMLLGGAVATTPTAARAGSAARAAGTVVPGRTATAPRRPNGTVVDVPPRRNDPGDRP